MSSVRYVSKALITLNRNKNLLLLVAEMQVFAVMDHLVFFINGDCSSFEVNSIFKQYLIEDGHDYGPHALTKTLTGSMTNGQSITGPSEHRCIKGILSITASTREPMKQVKYNPRGGAWSVC